MEEHDFEFASTIGDEFAETYVRKNGDETVFLTRGTSLGRYIILDILGSGGMGVVYLAFDPQLDRKVACKVLRKKRDVPAQLRLQREAKAMAMAKLSHPNVVSVYEVGTDGEQVYVAMELVDGQDMESWCTGDRSEREILAAYLQAGEGLAAAHRARLVHRDFKPQNVLIDKRGRVLVTDFGLAIQDSAMSMDDMLAVSPSDGVLASDNLTKTGVVMGTPVYMAPEQHLAQQVDARSDQFSYCVSLYEALCGQRPYPGERYDTLRNEVVNGQARVLPDSVKVSASVRNAIAKGLSRDPADRFPDMSDLLSEIGHRRRRKRASSLSRIGIAIALMLAGGALVFTFTSGSSSPATTCEVDSSILNGAWDTEIRSGLLRDFIATGTPGAERNFQVFSDHLDRYANKLLIVRKNICEEDKRLSDSGGNTLFLQLECMQKRRQGLAAVAAAFTGVEARYVERAAEAVLRLPSVTACQDIEALRRGVAAPPSGLKGEIQELRTSLTEAISLNKAGKLAIAISMAEVVRDKSLSIAYPPLRAEAHFELGRLLLEARRIDEAREALGEAVLVAEESDHKHVRAKSLVALADLFGSQSSNAVEAQRYTRLAQAAIKHSGDPHELILDFGIFQATQKLVNGKAREGLAQLLSLVRKLESWNEDTSLSHLDLLHRMVPFYHQIGDLEGANQTATKAHDLAQALLGDEHPTRIRHLGTLATSFRNLGRAETAHELHTIVQTFWQRDGADVYLRGEPGYSDEYRTVSGRVLNHGEPISDAVVVCGNQTMADDSYIDSSWDVVGDAVHRLRVVRSDGHGRFTCKETSTMKLVVLAEHTSMGRSLPVYVPTSKGDISGLILELLPTGSLSGIVVDPSSTATFRLIIAVTESDSLQTPSFQIAAVLRDGSYHFARLAEGRYHVRVASGSYDGKSNVMVHNVDVVGGRDTSLNFEGASGTAGVRMKIVGESGAQIFSVQVLLVTGHHDVHSAHEFTENVFSSDIILREKFVAEGEVLTYDKLAPGPYTLCFVPLAGDHKNAEYLRALYEENNETQVYHCHHLDLTAGTVVEDKTEVPPYQLP